MAQAEDCASVLDQFIHDVANLPAEITHMMEEVQAKERDMSKYQTTINQKDTSLQKHVKAHGSLNEHPREAEYCASVLKHHDMCIELQDQKIALSDKAASILERQVKKLDVKIRELQNAELLPNDNSIPSIFNRKQGQSDPTRNIFSQSLTGLDGTQALQPLSGNAINQNPATRTFSQSSAAGINSRLAQLQHANSRPGEKRASAPATPAPAQLLHPFTGSQTQHQRESSVGSAIDPKRRRLQSSTTSIPLQSSSLRQSSLGPGTPKATTPSRAGSVGARSATAGPTKKSTTGATKKTSAAPHQQVSKLKSGKPSKRSSSVSGTNLNPNSAAGPTKRRPTKGTSPAVRGSRAPSDSDDASVLSTTSSSAVHHHSHHAEPKREPSAEDDEDDDNAPEQDEEDNRKYCTCHEVSYGDMVGCENDSCPYEWFHLKCVGLAKPPGEEERWWCHECSEKGFPGPGGRPLGSGTVKAAKEVRGR